MVEFMLNLIYILGWLICLLLFLVPQIWGAFFTLSLLGHLSQFLPGSGNKRDIG